MDFRKLDRVIVFLIVLVFYGYFIKHGDWNINSRLGLVKAVVEEQRLTIDSFHTDEFSTEDKAFVDGHYYSDKAIGASILGVIAYWPIHQITGAITSYGMFVMWITLLAVGIPTALLAPMLYNMTIRLTQDRWIALATSLSICLGTALFPYAGAFYGHTLAAVAGFGAFFLWWEVRAMGARISLGRAFLSGLLIGFMVITEYPTAVIAVILIGYAAYVAWTQKLIWNWKFLLPFALGGLIPLTLLLAYNTVCFGSPFTTGYSHENLQEFQNSVGSGFMAFEFPSLLTAFYMTLHPAQGILIQSPVLFAALAGMFFAARNKSMRAEWIVAGSSILVFLLMFSGVGLWWGGDAFSSRYLIPILPFFGFFLAFIPKKFQPVVIGLGMISFAQMLIASATPFNGLNVATEKILQSGKLIDGDSFLLYSTLLPRLLKNKLTLTWGNTLLGIESWYFNLLIPILIAIVLGLVFVFIDKRQQSSSGSPDSLRTS
jgi:hypothetical protein